MNKILVIAAHPDDEVLGCGGIIHKFNVQDFIIMDGGRGDEIDQKFDTLPLKHWITKIEEAVNRVKPDAVFTHFIHDLNRDHQIISEATRVACRPQSGVKELYSYETFSSSHTHDFEPDTYITLDLVDIGFKQKLMLEKYPNEVKASPHPRSLEGIWTLAKYRGMQVESEYAEAFVTIRRQI